jgi:hypothetical protein
MKYVKTFESFNYSPVNEELFSKAVTPEVRAKIKAEVEARLNKLSDEDKMVAAEELVKFAKAKGLSKEQLSDPVAIETAIKNKNAAEVKQAETAPKEEIEKAAEDVEKVVGESITRYYYEGESLNEGWIMDKLKQAGNWLAKWLYVIGFGMMIASIIIAAVASAVLATQLAGVVTAVALAVSFTTFIIGGLINQKWGDGGVGALGSAAAAARRGPSSFR